MSDGIPQVRSPSTAIGEAARLAGENRTADADRIADRGRLEQNILGAQAAERGAALGALGELARFAGATVGALWERTSSRRRARAERDISFRMSDLSRAISRSDNPSQTLNEGVLELERAYKDSNEGIGHVGQQEELGLFYDDQRANEFPVLVDQAAAREQELYLGDWTEAVAAVSTEGDWAGVMDLYESAFDDGMLNRTEEQENMDKAVRGAQQVQASRTMNIMGEREGWDEAIEWAGSNEARDGLQYLKGEDWRNLQADMRSQRQVQEKRLRETKATEVASLDMWMLEELEGGRVASLQEIRNQAAESMPNATPGELTDHVERVWDKFQSRVTRSKPSRRDLTKRAESRQGRVLYQSLEEQGGMLTLETAPTYYKRVNTSHADGWITGQERKVLMAEHRRYFEESVGDNVSSEARRLTDNALKLTLLPGVDPGSITQDARGNYQVPRKFLGRVFAGPTKPAGLQDALERAEGDMVSLSGEDYREVMLAMDMPLVHPDGKMDRITFGEIESMVIDRANELIKVGQQEGNVTYTPQQAVQEIMWQTLAGFTPGLQVGEWEEKPEIFGGQYSMGPAYRGATVPDPGVTEGFWGIEWLGGGRPVDNQHPIARRFEFMGDAPGTPRRVSAQPLDRVQGVAAAEFIGASAENVTAMREMIQAGEFDAAQDIAAAVLPADADALDQLIDEGLIHDWFVEFVDDAGGTQMMVRFNPRSVPMPVGG